jgi:hypothetical protein
MITNGFLLEGGTRQGAKERGTNALQLIATHIFADFK